MENSVIISLSKKRVFMAIIGGLLFVIVGVLFAISPEKYVSPIMRTPEIIRVSGVVSILFFGLCFVFIFRKLFDNMPGLIVDEFGITDNTNIASVGLIKWSDIIGIERKQFSSSNILIVYTNDPQKYIQNAKNIVVRQLLKINYRTCGSPITITFSSIKANIDELEQLIKFELEGRSNK